MAVLKNEDNPQVKNLSESTLEDFEVEEVELVPDIDESKKSEVSVNVIEKREDTRGRLAQLFLYGFFICFIGVSIASFFVDPGEGKSSIDSLREAVLTISGILSGPLGFIIGYYFRKSEE